MNPEWQRRAGRARAPVVCGPPSGGALNDPLLFARQGKASQNSSVRARPRGSPRTAPGRRGYEARGAGAPELRAERRARPICAAAILGLRAGVKVRRGRVRAPSSGLHLGQRAAECHCEHSDQHSLPRAPHLPFDFPDLRVQPPGSCPRGMFKRQPCAAPEDGPARANPPASERTVLDLRRRTQHARPKSTAW